MGIERSERPMGKAENELPASALPPSSSDSAAGGNAGYGWCLEQSCCCCRRRGQAVAGVVRPRCVVAMVLGAAVLLSALFWLPPLSRHGGPTGRSDRDPFHTADVVASFRLQRPVDQLYDNIVKLQYDIFEEIGVRNSLVAIIALEPLGQPNWTNAVFGVWPYPKSSNLSATGLSILRSSFMSLVIGQSTIHLTMSLFGTSSLFQVLKFPGGITIIPLQSVFLLQKVQIHFNFTLNFPIYRVQDKINELKDQMKSGLLLNPNENLYVRLTNLEGSTVAPPTIVQTSVVLAVGNRQPSLPRWRQLAHNIRNSSAGNLGLNHTVFGKVKQIRLSSFLQHSPNNREVNGSPSPSPQPHINYHHHRHHHRHLAPVSAPEHGSPTAPPSGCPYRFPSKQKQYRHSAPSAAPVASTERLTAPAVASHNSSSSSPSEDASQFLAPSSAPHHLLTSQKHHNPLAPAPNILSPLPPLPFSHMTSPTGSPTDNKPPDGMPTISPSPYASAASGNCCLHWILVILFYALTSLYQEISLESGNLGLL